MTVCATARAASSSRSACCRGSHGRRRRHQRTLSCHNHAAAGGGAAEPRAEQRTPESLRNYFQICAPDEKVVFCLPRRRLPCRFSASTSVVCLHVGGFLVVSAR